MMPGWVRNWLRTSRTTRWAARPTAMISSEENRNTTDAPTISPTRTLGLSTDRLNVLAALPSCCSTVVRNEPNSAVAASPAVGLGEVPGEELDGAREHQADQHRADRQPSRVARVGQDAVVRHSRELAEARRQVGEGRDRHADRGDHGGDEEAAVDRAHAAA